MSLTTSGKAKVALLDNGVWRHKECYRQMVLLLEVEKLSEPSLIVLAWPKDRAAAGV